ncbi:MAG: glycerol-3-phosphate 1-O-acyltransferase PlsY [Candidatus Omnitrophica bacterium]|nr:glycerol-3-phosphate 1-O-acyltransferase PlsY [Candidatus Omnitrophota bacterium]
MFIFALIFSYFIGAIPFGFLVVKVVKNVDIRTVGSGNIGATNVTRVLGKKWGVFVFFLDFLKGAISPFIVNLFSENQIPLIYVLVFLCVVAGHNWTPFLKFKGGKGVSTSLGVIFGLCFKFYLLIVPVLISLFIWVILFFVFKYVSLASLSGAVSFSLISAFLNLPWEIKLLTFLILVFIVIRHRKNIKNLLTKRELKF